MPALSEELIGQAITINCIVQGDDFYWAETSVVLSTEYDLTKGVDITFDGQLYKNVPVAIETIGDDDYIVIGEFANQQPILTTYPFGIVLAVDPGR